MTATMIGLACCLLMAGAAAAQTPPPGLSSGSCAGQTVTFKGVRIPEATLADGEPLPAGTYDVRITSQRPEAAIGQSRAAACWVEFVRADTVIGREVASVIPADEIDAIAKTTPPKTGAARVDVLKGGDYLRVWLNDRGTHYLLNLAVSR